MKQKKISYQFVVVFSPKTEEKSKDAVWQKVEKWCQAVGAVVARKENLGSKDFCYEIAGFKKGDFWVADVEVENPVSMSEVSLVLNRDSNVIRYLVLKN